MKTVSMTTASRNFCALLEYVVVNRVPVLITKYGKPMARLEPIVPRKNDDILSLFQGKGDTTGDDIPPISAASKRPNKKR
jgi:prevent-host-death family protein